METNKRMNTGMVFQADTGAGGGGMPAGGSGGGNSQQPPGGTPGEPPGQAPTFETWYAGLDQTAKGLFDAHVNGLKSSLNTERQQRTDLARQVKDLAAKAEKGSDLERQLNDMQTTLQAVERRAAFAEDALRPEVGCVNLKAAWALASAENLFDRQGRPDWNALKQTAPELFRKAGAGNVDGGAGNQQQNRLSMNDIIRRAAGRG